MSWRLGIDIGGTFTDFVAIEAQNGRSIVFKLPSDRASPAAPVLAGLERLESEFGVAPSHIEYLGHGSTVATNALIERRGAAVGLLVTAGFEDLLLIARLAIPGGPDLQGEMAAPLVPRQLVRPIHERLTASGAVRTGLEDAEVAAAARELAELGVESLAVCFLHSYRYPKHERRALEVIRRELPGLSVWLSSDIWPEIREYERSLLTAMNAYLGGRVSEYYVTLEKDAVRKGLRGPILITQGNGGLVNPAGASARPITTLQSGPAAGVSGAIFLAKAAGVERIVTLDIGGTSTDVCIIDRRVPITTDVEVADLPIAMPLVEVNSIGAGGGSLAWVDRAGLLMVGPESAGAVPGPACYGRGGDRATLTDAYVGAGLIDADSFLGGEMRLDIDRSHQVLTELGRRIGRSAQGTAEGIVDIVTSKLYAQVISLFARKGLDLREFTLMLFGGAGPTHGFLLAEEIGIRRVIVPAAPGLLCALGCLSMDVRRDFVKTVNVDLSVEPSQWEQRLTRSYDELAATALDWLAGQQLLPQDSALEWSGDMRYIGQAYSLLTDYERSIGTDPAGLTDAFNRAHSLAFGHSDQTAPIELVSIRVTAIGRAYRLDSKAVMKSSGPARAETSASRASRMVRLGGRAEQAEVHDRRSLQPGDEFQGPAVIEQYDSTAYVPSTFRCRVDSFGNIIGEARS
jgi:N-methylhydantoinase A